MHEAFPDLPRPRQLPPHELSAGIPGAPEGDYWRLQETGITPHDEHEEPEEPTYPATPGGDEITATEPEIPESPLLPVASHPVSLLIVLEATPPVEPVQADDENLASSKPADDPPSTSMEPQLPSDAEQTTQTEIADQLTVAEPEPEPEPADAPPEPKKTARYIPWGNLDPETIEATHAFRPAEEVSGVTLDAYYAVPKPKLQNNIWKAWHKAEHGLGPDGTPDDIAAADSLAGKAIHEYRPRYPEREVIAERFDNASIAEAWHDAATVKAAIPGFKDRQEYGEVRPISARRTYKIITEEIMPHIVNGGNAAESIVFALGARAASLGDPERFLYPGSPREDNNPDQNELGQVYNHDLYQIVGGVKDPLEIKTRSGTTMRTIYYDPSVTVIKCMNELAPVIMDVHLDRITRLEAFRLVPVFIRTVHQLMLGEINTDRQSSVLDAATAALWKTIDQNRQRKETDPRLRSPRLESRRRQAR
jgi:hypothetical protein